jgi:hypothetical protein
MNRKTAPGGDSVAPSSPAPVANRVNKGWNELRETISANQKRLGVIPQDAKLTPWPDDLLTSPFIAGHSSFGGWPKAAASAILIIC